MFGYIIPDKNNMYIKDFNTFRAFYCGLCRALKSTGGPATRLCTNYDMTFYSVLISSLLDRRVNYENKVCGLNLRKHTSVEVDEFSKKMADLTVLLAYYNVEDDIIDGRKGRIVVKWRLYLRKRAAKKRLPEADSLMRESFSRLHKLEKAACDSIDEAADTFASLMRDITKTFVDTDEYTDCFTYSLGRLVYLMDAVDDVYSDSKKKRYNPLLLNYGKCEDKAEYLKNNADELSFLLKSTYNRLVASYNKMNITLYEGVLSNTVYLGILMQIERLLKGEEKCQITRL